MTKYMPYTNLIIGGKNEEPWWYFTGQRCFQSWALDLAKMITVWRKFMACTSLKCLDEPSGYNKRHCCLFSYWVCEKLPLMRTAHVDGKKKIDQILTCFKSLLGLISFCFVAFSSSFRRYFSFTCLINLPRWIPNSRGERAVWFWINAMCRYSSAHITWHLGGGWIGERLWGSLLVSSESRLATQRSGIISLLSGWQKNYW